MVFLPGRRPFIFTDEKAEEVVGRLFPELNDDQVRRAARRLRTTIITRLRAAEIMEAVADGADIRPWKDRW
ncbi:hypothetical protein [Novosphingobium indicum]|nr:hypothetical protein [Novosphingobium indicum]